MDSGVNSDKTPNLQLPTPKESRSSHPGDTRSNYRGLGETTSGLRTETASARGVRVTSRAFVVELRDGRTVSVPLAWYPRLAHGTPLERRHWELIGPRLRIHWPTLDEDISVEGLLQGRPSGEGAASFSRWLQSRQKPATKRVKATRARQQKGTKRSSRA